MEYLPGGDLYSLLQNISALDEESAKTYTIQIANALGYLHSRGIIHRDIKPDNILVAADGTLKLTDFGLSYLGVYDRKIGDISTSISSPKKSSKSTTHEQETIVESKSLVGTPDYVAPEIILSLPHSFAVDWWSLGVMLYEFIMGVPPFHGESINETQDRILRGVYQPPPSDEFSPECIDFIKQLLKQNPKERLGGNGGIADVMKHPWVKGIDISKRDPPFVPELKNELDTEYFEERYEPSDKDDSDIFADIQLALLEVPNVSKVANSGSSSFIGSPRNNSFYASSDLSDSNADTEINAFPSVAVEQLVNQNMIAANRIKRSRASSLINVEDNNSTSNSDMSLRRSFDIDSAESAQPVARRKRRIPVMQSRASTDEFIKKLLPLSRK